MLLSKLPCSNPPRPWSYLATLSPPTQPQRLPAPRPSVEHTALSLSLHHGSVRPSAARNISSLHIHRLQEARFLLITFHPLTSHRHLGSRVHIFAASPTTLPTYSLAVRSICPPRTPPWTSALPSRSRRSLELQRISHLRDSLASFRVHQAPN